MAAWRDQFQRDAGHLTDLATFSPAAGGRECQQPDAEYAGNDERYPACPHRYLITGNDHFGVRVKPRRVTESENAKNDRRDT
jgi:hypothetical protein